jgi:hypothetical protein
LPKCHLPDLSEYFERGSQYALYAFKKLQLPKKTL